MRFLSLLILILNFSRLSAQADSLLKVAGTLPHDSDRVNLFYKEGWKQRITDPLYSYECAELASACAKKLRLPFYTAKVLHLKGVLFYRKGDLGRALRYHKKALSLREKVKDERGIALSQVNLGNIYGDLGITSAAEHAYNDALKYFLYTDDQPQIGNCLINLGTLNAEQASSEKDSLYAYKATDYFLRALQKGKEFHDLDLQARALNDLAVVYLIQQEHDKAIASAMDALKCFELMDAETDKVDAWLNIALAHGYKKETREMEETLMQCDSLIRRSDLLPSKIQWLKLMSSLYEQKNDPVRALVFLKRRTVLKDSLQNANKRLHPGYDFPDGELDDLIENKDHGFPFIYMNILLVTALLCAALIFYRRT